MAGTPGKPVVEKLGIKPGFCIFTPGAPASYATIVGKLPDGVTIAKRLKAPLIDLKMLKNSLLVGATVAILIGAGTINGLMYLLSLYFQEPSTLGFTAFEAGLATLPATVGLVVIAGER